jgi:hypothetical protein
MLPRIVGWIVLTAVMPLDGLHNECKVQDGQIWRGVFQQECGCSKQATTDERGPFCTVDAKVSVSQDGELLNITDLSYGACSAVNTTSCSFDSTARRFVCGSTLSLENMEQLRCGSRLGIQNSPCDNPLSFKSTNASHCDSGELVFQYEGSPGNPNTVSITGHIGNGSLIVHTNFFSVPCPSCFSCAATWKFFAPPALHLPGVAIQSRTAGLCLDLPGGDTKNGNKLWLWKCLGNANQQWKFVNGQLVYANSPTPKCVDLFAGDVSNGQQLEIWDCAQTPQQQWSFDANLGTIFLSKRLGQESLKCMDLRNGGQDGKNVVQVWDCSYGAWNQQWLLFQGGHGVHPQPNAISEQSHPDLLLL